MSKFKATSADSTTVGFNSRSLICGLPLRLDSYNGCTHRCSYCFSNKNTFKVRKAGGVIINYETNIRTGNVKAVEKALHSAYIDNANDPLSRYLRKGVPLHCGGNSDPFQPLEDQLHITKQIIDVCNNYNQRILFSTKGYSTYGADIRPDLHSFQLSFSNYDRPDIEPGVASFERRVEFFKELKAKGCKVGIRLQPFIPNITSLKIIETFVELGADHFIIEAIKGVGTYITNDYAKEVLGINLSFLAPASSLSSFGCLSPNYRLASYYPFIKYFQEHNVSWSVSDNDLRYLSGGPNGPNNCCCGDALTWGTSTKIDTTYNVVNDRTSKESAFDYISSVPETGTNGIEDYGLKLRTTESCGHSFKPSCKDSLDALKKELVKRVVSVYSCPFASSCMWHPNDEELEVLKLAGYDYDSIGIDLRDIHNVN